MRYNFGNGNLLKYPYNQLRVWIQEDMKIPGQDLQFVQEDNILLSIKRGINDKMFLNRTVGAEYIKEYISGFSYNVSYKNTLLTPQGNLNFNYYNYGELTRKNSLITSEIGFNIRYAPNEKFYEGAHYRTPILNKYPKFELRYDVGIKGLANSEYNYHRLHVRGEKVFYVTPLGYSHLIVEYGKIFGKVPYPLLNIHRANQTYSYQIESYNLMNFMEFASDQYFSLNYLHNFNGAILGRLPLINRLKWRELISIKSLWGSINERNLPNEENGLLLFPTQNSQNFNSPTIVNSLGSKPYIEASVGIGNIFKIFRVDYVWRVNYRDLPNAPNAGVRVRVKFEF